jgi:hypothetical protein
MTTSDRIIKIQHDDISLSAYQREFTGGASRVSGAHCVACSCSQPFIERPALARFKMAEADVAQLGKVDEL